MYEPPVQISESVERICEEISKAKEEYVYSQIRAVVDVDKEELLKALKYDRQQLLKLLKSLADMTYFHHVKKKKT